MSLKVFDAVGRIKQAVYGPPVPFDPWHVVGAAGEPAFQNSWVNFDTPSSTSRDARFRKFPDGRVRITGVVKSGTNGASAFTLPAGYRPPRTTLSFVVEQSGGIGFVHVGNDGAVSIVNLTGAGGTFTFLDSVEFDTESVFSMPGGPAGQAPLVSALPANPVHGQEIRYQAAAGVIWYLVYNALSSSPYKWEWCGGSKLNSEILASEAIAGASWQDAPTNVGPSLTVPLAGEYDIEFAAHISMNAGAGVSLGAAVKFGAAAVTDPDDASHMSASGTSGFTNTPVGRTLRRTIAAAATVVKIQYWGGNATGGNFSRRALRIQPVRVG